MSKTKYSASQLVGTAILAALVVILQSLSGILKIGAFNVTLTLVPIVLGAILYGPFSGGALGAVFGLVVSFAVVTGADPGGFVLFGLRPVITILICILKSSAAGYLSGTIAKMLAKKSLYLSVMLAAIAAPMLNTGIFVLGLLLFFYETLVEWAAGSANVLTFVIVGLIGTNFLLELVINLVLAPVIIRIIHAVRQSRNSERG